MKFWILWIAFGTVPMLLAQEQKSISLFSQGGGRFVDEFTITVDQLTRLPQWSPLEDPKPPVSITEAIKHSTSHLDASARGWPWKITAISLMEGQHQESKGVWFYHIHAHINVASEPGKIHPLPFSILVLMDGTSLYPKVEIPTSRGLSVKPPPIKPRRSSPVDGLIRLFFQGNSETEDHYSITPEHAGQLPQWHPRSNVELCFEAHEALSIIHQRVREKLPGQEWRLLQFSLMPGSFPESHHIWHYHINLLHRPKGYSGDSKLWNHCLLLDGTLISPDPFEFK